MNESPLSDQRIRSVFLDSSRKLVFGQRLSCGNFRRPKFLSSTYLLSFCTKGGICFRLPMASLFARRARSSRASMLSLSAMFSCGCCCWKSSPKEFQLSAEGSKTCLGAVGTKALLPSPLRASAVDGAAGIPWANCPADDIIYGFTFRAAVSAYSVPSGAAPFHLRNWSGCAGANCCCCIGDIGIGTMGDAPGAARFREFGEDIWGYIRSARACADLEPLA